MAKLLDLVKGVPPYVVRGKALSKAGKPPSGYSPIPGGKKGGYRKRTASGWDYWYPDGKQGKQGKLRSHDGLMKKVLTMPAGSRVVFSGEGRGGRDVSQKYYIGSSTETRDGRTLVYLAKTNKKFPSGKPVLTHVFDGFKINPLGGGARNRPNTHTLNHIVSADYSK